MLGLKGDNLEHDGNEEPHISDTLANFESGQFEAFLEDFIDFLLVILVGIEVEMQTLDDSIALVIFLKELSTGLGDIGGESVIVILGETGQLGETSDEHGEVLLFFLLIGEGSLSCQETLRH